MSLRAKVKIITTANNYNALDLLARNVIANMTANVASFPTPAPTLVALSAQEVILANLITAWGVAGARGSHQDLMNLRAASFSMRNMLVQEAAYVQNLVNPSDTYADQAAFILLSGFAVKNAATPQGVLGAPTNLHQFFSQTISINFNKLKWKKPIGLNSKVNVKSYFIARMVGGPPTMADVIATTTKTSFVDNTAVAGTSYNYYVAGNNDAGIGVWAGPLNIFSL